MEAIILAGGFGTRLRSVCSDRPKPMADIQGKPFIEYLLEYWKLQGVAHFILSVGYMHQMIIHHFGMDYQGIPIDYAIENEPLGTGGGLLQSIPYLHHPDFPFLVLNGDTFFNIPLTLFFYKKEVTLALYQVEKNTRYHGVTLEEGGLITNLKDSTSTLINGGCYLFNKKTLGAFRQKGPISLEEEILPILIRQENCYGQLFDGLFLDIGVPEDYERGQSMPFSQIHPAVKGLDF